MEAELSKEYDVIVVGTGLVECMVAAASSRVGKKVLHIDKNDYYGSQWASFSLAGIQQWLEDLGSPQDDAPQGSSSPEEGGERLDPTCDPRRAYSRVKAAWHVPEAPEPGPAVAVSGHEEGPGAKTELAKTEVAKTEVAKTEVAKMDPEAKEEEKWTQEKMLGLSRKFNIDLAPKLLYSRGPMVELLISSNVARYTEFKCVTRVLAWRPSDDPRVGGGGGELLVVPCSRSDVFTTGSVSLVEKRLLMKFLEFCHSYDERPEQLQEFEDRTFSDFLRSRKLTENLVHFVAESIAMSGAEASCREGLESMKLFLTSLGRYGATPFLFSMYGCGELPQAFCRLCAVFEGTYVLRREVSSLVVDARDARLCRGILSEGQRFECSHVVMEASCAPRGYVASGEQGGTQSVSRGIFITDRSILCSEKEQLTLLRLPAKDGNPQPITVVEVGAGSGVCPKDLHCVQMTCLGSDAEEDLRVAVQRLFSDEDAKRPSVLWSLYFNRVDYSGSDLTSNAPANVHLCPGPQAELDYDSAITQAKGVFLKMFPDEEFLPRAPDPEEIVFDNEGAEPKEGDNFGGDGGPPEAKEGEAKGGEETKEGEEGQSATIAEA